MPRPELSKQALTCCARAFYPNLVVEGYTISAHSTQVRPEENTRLLDNVFGSLIVHSSARWIPQ